VQIKLLIFTALLFTIGMFSSPVFGDAVSGNLKYTTFQGGQNVWSIDYSYDGVSTITFSNDVNLCSTNGADGILGNPQNPDLLLIGGQGPRINTCSISTGAVVTYASPVNVYHMEVPDATTVYGNSIPGALAYHTINPDGTLTAGTAVTLSAASGCTGDTVITQLITTPSGIFYANDGIFGTLTFTGATTAETCRLYGAGGQTSATPLPGAHGGVYDPFTNTIITMGNTCVTQLSSAGVLIGSNCFAGGTFDQGTVDGKGHAFIAQNPNIFFLDYRASGLVDTPTFSASTLVRTALDDVAPLVGMGSTHEEFIGGEIIPINSAALLLAGVQSSLMWMAPIVAGIAGVSMLVFRLKR